MSEKSVLHICLFCLFDYTIQIMGNDLVCDRLPWMSSSHMITSPQMMTPSLALPFKKALKVTWVRVLWL